MTSYPPEPDPYQAPYQPVPYGQPPYPPQPYGYQQAQPIYVQGPPTSAFAVISLILGILGLFAGWCTFAIPCLLAIGAGHMALVETKNGRHGGRGIAIAGLVLGYLVVIPAGILTFVAFGTGVFGE